MQTDLQKEALLNLDVRLATTPAVTIVNAGGMERSVTVPDVKAPNGFAFELDALVSFEALGQVLRTFLQGKRLELTEGFISQHILIDNCRLESSGNDLIAQVAFSGSYTGIIYLKGTPFYNTLSRQVELQSVTYELETKSLLLKGMKWIFGKLILEEIKKYTSIDVTRYYDLATQRINELLNKKWSQGIQASGTTEAVAITGIQVGQEQLLIRTCCSGSLKLTITEQAFKF